MFCRSCVAGAQVVAICRLGDVGYGILGSAGRQSIAVGREGESQLSQVDLFAPTPLRVESRHMRYAIDRLSLCMAVPCFTLFLIDCVIRIPTSIALYPGSLFDLFILSVVFGGVHFIASRPPARNL